MATEAQRARNKRKREKSKLKRKEKASLLEMIKEDVIRNGSIKTISLIDDIHNSDVCITLIYHDMYINDGKVYFRLSKFDLINSLYEDFNNLSGVDVVSGKEIHWERGFCFPLGKPAISHLRTIKWTNDIVFFSDEYNIWLPFVR